MREYDTSFSVPQSRDKTAFSQKGFVQPMFLLNCIISLYLENISTWVKQKSCFHIGDKKDHDAKDIKMGRDTLVFSILSQVDALTM